MEQIEKIQGTEKEFIKVFQELCYSRSSWQVWADLMTAMACTLANSLDKTEPRHTAREKEYAECIKRLGGVEKPAKCFAIVVEALERNPNQDFLGKLYMSLELGNHWKGQFFTPYNVCECMAGITINDNIQTLEKQEWIKYKIEQRKADEEITHATGRVLFWLHHAIVKGEHNGELEEAFENLQRAEAHKKEMDREVLAKYSID